MNGSRRWLALGCVLAAGCSGASTPPDDEDGVSDGRDTVRDDGGESTLPDASPLPAACGDGRQDSGEECDDGNRVSGDGCNWMCRLDDEPFVYPPVDPGAPHVEPDGPPAVLTEVGEVSSFVGTRLPSCQAVWLASGPNRFAVAYDYDQPYYGVRLRLLERSGATVGSPWQHETSWALFPQALVATEGGFGLLSGSDAFGLLRSRFEADGGVTEEFATLRGPLDVRGVAGQLMGAAWSSGRWLAASTVNGAEFRGWLLETFDDDGTPLFESLVAHDPLGSCVSAAPVDDGFAVGDGNMVVRVDAELHVVSWSGVVPADGPARSAAVGLAQDGYWLTWIVDRGEHIAPYPFDLWIVATDFDGVPRFPPRRILESLPRPITGDGAGSHADESGLAVTDGPGGAAIVFWQHDADGPLFGGGPVMLLTVDEWANVVTPPLPVLADGESTTIGWATAVAADDGGYAVVTMRQGETLGTATIVFRYFAAVPSP